MLSLVLRGKLSVTEDVLTAVVFDTLEQEREGRLLEEFLLGATTQGGDRFAVPRFDAFAVELWPRTAAGEPDVRIRLSHHGDEVARIIIEAKLGAAKSGIGDLADGRGDQLGRYLLAEWHQYHPPVIALVYLTHHARRPNGELESSACALEQAGHDWLASRLFWRSWRDLEALLDSRPAPWDRVARILGRTKMFRYRGQLPSVPAFDASPPDWWSRVGPRRRPRPDFGWPQPPKGLQPLAISGRRPQWPMLGSELSLNWTYPTGESHK